ncbi:MAG: putative signal transduction histidine kinase [Spirosoma sp.]|nr:putative signal transduction histidine kinase [Spirosoma sp.]
MKWPSPISNPESRQRLKRHLLFWLVVYIALPISLCATYVLAAIRSHSLTPLSQLAQLLLVYLPYMVTFVYVGLYWVLPPVLIKQYGLFVRRYLSYACSGLITHYLIRIFIVLPLRAGHPAVFTNYHSFFSPAGFLTMLVLTGVAVGIKLFRVWYQRNQANQQLVRQTLLIELQVLKAQLHPHFLFNTLNNLYSLILKQSPQASAMVLKLSKLLHYMIHECSSPLVPLGKEIEFIQDYIELEKLRYGPRLTVAIDVSGQPNTTFIAPLVFIPFVENAFKHGAAKQIDSACIDMALTVQDNILRFRLENSHSEPAGDATREGEGLGLMNVRKRLALLYPNAHELTIQATASSFIVELSITLGSEPQPTERLAAVLQTDA